MKLGHHKQMFANRDAGKYLFGKAGKLVH